MPCLKCSSSGCSKNAIVRRTADETALCAACFTERFEQDVHNTIVSTNLFNRGERVAIGASGGKDSTVLAYVMKAVERNHVDYSMPLTIFTYKDLYGWTMDEIVAKIGKKNNCTFCGVFRRQALDRGAYKLGATKLLTGHNADDMAETVLMNVLRGDVPRLQRCTSIITGEEGELPRAKPLKYCFEKDIVMYARLNKLDYFYTECKYAPDSYRAYSRTYVKELERIRPQTILALIESGENIIVRKEVVMPKLTNCTRCGYISSKSLCKACLLLEGLNTDCAGLGIKRKPKKVAVVDDEQAQSAEKAQGCGTASCDCEQNPGTSF